jgi:2-dehydropantoate 2-reductase
MTPMKIGIIGAGAMGSIYGGLLGDAGNEIWLLDVWQEHVEAVRSRGIRVQGASGDRTVRVNATLDARDAGSCDLVIVSTKGYATEEGVRNGQAMIGRDTLVLTLQNGLGNAEKMAALIGSANLLVGIAGGFGASVAGPGHVHHNAWEAIHIGEFHGGVTPRLDRVVELWTTAGFRAKAFEDIQSLVWSKLLGNVGFSPVCTITQQRMGEVIANPCSWAITESLVKEAFTVARAKNVTLAYDDPIAWVREYGSKMPLTRPSMWLDIEAGRRSEIDTINGGVVREARALGVPVPVNVTMVNLVKALERKTTVPQPRSS